MSSRLLNWTKITKFWLTTTWVFESTWLISQFTALVALKHKTRWLKISHYYSVSATSSFLVIERHYLWDSSSLNWPNFRARDHNLIDKKIKGTYLMKVTTIKMTRWFTVVLALKVKLIGRKRPNKLSKLSRKPKRIMLECQSQVTNQ
jgi:hypothetical protein